MNTVVFEHVPIGDLPAAWRAKLPKTGFARESQVTVHIEQEVSPAVQEQAAPKALMANPMVGMWPDREDMAEVAGYVRDLRAPRLNADSSRRKKAA